MIFAAGNGTRLRPFTLSHPKALAEVGGVPMLGRVILSLRDAGITRMVVNVHHFAGQVEEYLAANDGFGCDIAVSDERERLLDTGGGLLKARVLLPGDEPVLLHNVDVCTDLDLAGMALADGCDAALLTAARDSSRQLTFRSEDMRLQGWVDLKTGATRGNPDGVRRAFGGIHVVGPRVFDALESYSRTIGSDSFSLTPFYVDMADSLDIRGLEFESYRWFDIGRPESLEAACRSMS